MSANLCHHIYDTGGSCASTAVNGQYYCVNHLRHRARLMRMAQYRARNQRLALRLPPLDNMHAVASALNQLAEAAAAGMIDLKLARYLLSVVRATGQFLLKADKWPTNPCYPDQPGVEIDLVKEYGLPADTNLDVNPEFVYPPPDDASRSVILSEGDAFSAAASHDLPSRPERSGAQEPVFSDNRLLTTDSLPLSGDFCPDHHSRECDCVRIRADYPMTPERVELLEIQRTQGGDAAIARYKQQQRNQRRRYNTTERKRYEAIALEHNMRRAAERLAQQKLAATAQERGEEVGVQSSESGCPTPPSVGGVGVFVEPGKKPVASITPNPTQAKSTA